MKFCAASGSPAGSWPIVQSNFSLLEQNAQIRFAGSRIIFWNFCALVRVKCAMGPSFIWSIDNLHSKLPVSAISELTEVSVGIVVESLIDWSYTLNAYFHRGRPLEQATPKKIISIITNGYVFTLWRYLLYDIFLELLPMRCVPTVDADIRRRGLRNRPWEPPPANAMRLVGFLMISRCWPQGEWSWSVRGTINLPSQRLRVEYANFILS